MNWASLLIVKAISGWVSMRYCRTPIALRNFLTSVSPGKEENLEDIGVEIGFGPSSLNLRRRSTVYLWCERTKVLDYKGFHEMLCDNRDEMRGRASDD